MNTIIVDSTKGQSVDLDKLPYPCFLIDKGSKTITLMYEKENAYDISWWTDIDNELYKKADDLLSKVDDLNKKLNDVDSKVKNLTKDTDSIDKYNQNIVELIELQKRIINGTN